MSEQPQGKPQQAGPQFSIQKIYSKDISFESPGVPQIFTEKWEPEVNLDINTASKSIGEGVFEVVLTLTATVKLADKTAYLAEVKQAGIFTVVGFKDNELGHILAAACPNVLFPFGREAVADLVTKGGFPQLLLAPVNFDALYAQHLAGQKQAQQESKQVAPEEIH
jgi:preprotein translocase subunit SecB